MVAHSILAAIAVVSVLGVGAAAASGIFSNSGSGNFDLGTLTPGETGSATATATVDLANASMYEFELEMEDRIGSTFSHFSLVVTVNGQTFNLTSDHSEKHLSLSSGTHTFSAKLGFTVRDIARSFNVSNVGFLFLHPVESQLNHSADHGISSVQASSEGSFQPGNGSSQRITLFTISFHFSGNLGPGHEDRSSDSNRESLPAVS